MPKAIAFVSMVSSYRVVESWRMQMQSSEGYISPKGSVKTPIQDLRSVRHHLIHLPFGTSITKTIVLEDLQYRCINPHGTLSWDSQHACEPCARPPPGSSVGPIASHRSHRHDGMQGTYRSKIQDMQANVALNRVAKFVGEVDLKAWATITSPSGTRLASAASELPE